MKAKEAPKPVPADKKDKKEKKPELSEEDEQLKELIAHLVEKITAPTETSQEKIRYIAQLFNEVKQSGNTGTTLPKQLKFLQPDFPKLVEFYGQVADLTVKKPLADLLSLVSPTLAENYSRDSLRYYREGTGNIDFAILGDEYLLNLAGDLSGEYEAMMGENEADLTPLFNIASHILPRLFKNGHEINAVDLLLEIERLDLLPPYLDSQNYPRIFNYLVASVEYTADHHDFEGITTCLYDMAITFQDYTNALRVALRVNDYSKINAVLAKCSDNDVKKQLALAIGRHRIFNLENPSPEIQQIVSNQMLSKFYLELQKDLDVAEPKLPADVYKSLLEGKDQKIDSAQLNLADSFVNGLVNIGGLKEKLINNPADKDKPWVSRVKDEGIMSTVASLGLVYMWDFEAASEVLSEYLGLKDGFHKAGACIALGLATSGVWDENDPAKALLLDCIESTDASVKLGATIGLGLAYTGSSRGDFKEMLEALINDENLPIETSACAALSQALINVADCDEDVSNSILTSLMVFQKSTLDHKFAKFFAVALGINFMGRLNKSEAVGEALAAIEHPISKYTQLVVEICSNIGTTNVLLVQKYMQLAAKEAANDSEAELQAVALLGVALLSIAEPSGRSIFMRLIHQILYYATPALKRVVPVMLTIMGIVNSNIQISDMLFKLAHDEDSELAYRAIFGLGIVSAGTNNSRIATLLRSLGSYYDNENNYQYVIRLALGILHAGKGLVGINPFYSDEFLYSKSGLAGLTILGFTMLNFEDFLIKKNHYMLYYLSLAMYPKMLFYVTPDMKEIKTNVRVGQAVDTVGQVGKPRNITGFQTHTSPVIINLGERAELATEEYLPVAQVVQENFVVLKKNPEYVEKK